MELRPGTGRGAAPGVAAVLGIAAALGLGAPALGAAVSAAATLELAMPVGDLVWLDAQRLVVPDAVLRPTLAGAGTWVAPSPDLEAQALVPCGPDADAACAQRQAMARRALDALPGQVDLSQAEPATATSPTPQAPSAVEVGLRVYRVQPGPSLSLEARVPIWRGLAPLEGPDELRVRVLAAGPYILARATTSSPGSGPAWVIDRDTLAPVGLSHGVDPELLLPDGRLVGRAEAGSGAGPQGLPRGSLALYALLPDATGWVSASWQQTLWQEGSAPAGHVMSPDGRLLLVRTHDGYALLDIATGEHQRVYRSPLLGPPVAAEDGQSLYALDLRGNLVLFEAATLRESTTTLLWSPGSPGGCRFGFVYGPVAVLRRRALVLCEPGAEQPMSAGPGAVGSGKAALWAFDLARRQLAPWLPVSVADPGRWLLGLRLAAVSADGRLVAVREDVGRVSLWQLPP